MGMVMYGVIEKILIGIEIIKIIKFVFWLKFFYLKSKFIR